jgi:hypothetical protein
MRSGRIPFQFDITEVLKRVGKFGGKHVGPITVRLPFISFTVNPKDREKQIARETVIRLKDRRVLSSSECCDGCIDKALTSLQEVRALLVEKQVELADFHDGPLYLFIDTMADGIRQFLTFEQRLKANAGYDRSQTSSEFWRDADMRQAYFDGLELLRGHLSHSLVQIANIAGMVIPDDGMLAHYKGEWRLDAYKSGASPKN